MKNIVFLFFINYVTISGQINISASIGANYSKFNSILFGREYFNTLNKYYKYQTFPNLGIDISYQKNKFIYLTGVYYSYRGGRDYNVPNFFFNNEYEIDINGYIEIPLQLSYTYYKNKFNSGIGIILHRRLYTGTSYYEERNKLNGLDLRITSTWNINRRFALSPAYTLGNFDKYISNTRRNFLHHVFSLNLRYNFLILNQK